ncbi:MULTISPECIES: sigma-54-dependent transcriptional regulator [unclassified Methylophaga]|jgi:two-component system response regulator FlrC|uniref:sigma-54-dependent transcriptional regulator n=1 Tax=unclassified Methylophaga TaxID=2629249 RepID=UPI000C95E2E1|nr:MULTISPECIES: sigma-54 dependent transcriptional regulator [unclassified Methylophaga]MAP26608.1 sigma-54-dependent Fis family transcriptional regulator [Methylophaga sp.]|tara:strand:+ start:74050 stop:75435 length:1386 start_codon:yes stop_codon:yes gene_type:complete
MNQSMIMVVEDDANLRTALCDTLELAGYKVTSTDHGQKALDKLANEPIGLLLSDLQMQPMDGHTLLKKARAMLPSLPVVLMTAYGSVQSAVEAMHEGACDYLMKPFEADDLLQRVQRYVRILPASDDMVAAAKSSVDLQALARRVAETDATVLINGESGTGKEVLARFIHRHSPRQDGPFIAINCAAIPESMLEATLFGYEKGAFTGAAQAYAGKFEQANQGTILLDEITEMDISLQAKLLRVLQEREVERLGGRKTLSLDVRVLATTNRTLRDEVKAGRFREDLFYRLNVFPLQLLPLRERPQDIVPLAEQLLERHCKQGGRVAPHFDSEAKRKLSQHNWPGNVRELDNVLQRALILQTGSIISADDLAYEAISGAQQTTNELNATPVTEQSETVSPVDNADDLRSHEQRHILDILAKHRGSRRETAKELGISERTLRYKISRFREQGIAIPGKFGKKSA